MTNTVNIISYVVLALAFFFWVYASRYYRVVTQKSMELLENVACRSGYENGMTDALCGNKYDEHVPSDDFLKSYYDPHK